MKKILSKISFRNVVQIIIVAVVVSLALTHQKLGIEKVAPIDAYCPFGAVESFFTLIFKGEFLKRIFISSFILLAIFVIGTLFLGRFFCGYFCPLGALQEWFYALAKKLGFKKKLELPKKIDKYLRYIKYFVLLIIIYFSFYLGDLIFRNYDPYSSLMHFGQEFEEKIIGYIILALILISAFFVKSLWCRYFCPLGAFFSLIRKIGFLKITRNDTTCIGCGLCDTDCPANLNIQTADTIKDKDCISCGKCVNHCPEQSLNYNIFNKPITKKNFLILLVFIVILPLIIIPFTPIWKTKPESNIISPYGTINTGDIRGSNTLKYLLDTTKVPLHTFEKKLGLPKNIDTSLKLKDIGPKYNLKNEDGNPLETEDFRKVVEEYLKNNK